MKTCSQCNTTKELTEFTKRTISKDGYRRICKECTNIKQNENRNEKLEAYKETRRIYTEKNIDKIRNYSSNYMKKWNKENNDKRNEYARNYYHSNQCNVKEKNKVTNIKRRALKHTNSDETINFKALELLKEKQKHKCYYCNSKLDFKNKNMAHLDHYIPLALGGIHSINNVVWSCKKCNLSKGKVNPFDFANKLGRLF